MNLCLLLMVYLYTLNTGYNELKPCYDVNENVNIDIERRQRHLYLTRHMNVMSHSMLCHIVSDLTWNLLSYCTVTKWQCFRTWFWIVDSYICFGTNFFFFGINNNWTSSEIFS